MGLPTGTGRTCVMRCAERSEMATVRYVYGQHETLLTTDFEDSPVPRVDEFVYLEVPKDRIPIGGMKCTAYDE